MIDPVILIARSFVDHCDETAQDPTAELVTLRDLFAGCVLIGDVANGGTPTPGRGDESRRASDAYRLADAMLAERSKGQ
jgi:hypothetical protein